MLPGLRRTTAPASDRLMLMQVGAVLSQTELGPDVSVLRDYAQAVQDLGFDFLVTFDHVVGADPADHPDLERVFSIDSYVREPLLLGAFLAGVAPRLGHLSSVIILPQRQTVLVAKQAADLDVLCGGRLRLGVGIGWNPIEFQALGMGFRDRARRFEEQISLMRRLWTERVVTFDGQFHRVKAAGINPRPVQQPVPIWIGASAEAAVKRATRIADGYLPLRPLDGGWQATIDKIHAWLGEAGREPSTFGIEGRLDTSKGTPDDWRATVEMWRGFGASHLSVGTSGAGPGLEPHLARLRQVRALLQP
jgi:probable F420-dependent oxidoreductase